VVIPVPNESIDGLPDDFGPEPVKEQPEPSVTTNLFGEEEEITDMWCSHPSHPKSAVGSTANVFAHFVYATSFGTIAIADIQSTCLSINYFAVVHSG
jgi:hypothetical protein